MNGGQITMVFPALMCAVPQARAKCAAALPDVRERIKAQHGEVVGSTPAEFSRFAAAEIAGWTRVAKAENINAQ